ncbi:MAG: ABC transporter permease [Chloroflexi bacterium]|nr:ABC transporter permease [Chloroflexota bacterium]
MLWGKLPHLTPLLLALRNMRARWMRTLLTCAGIVLGVAVILAISVTNDSTLQSIRNVFDEASGKANLIVQSSSADGKGFDESIAARVRSAENVEAVAPSAQVTTLLARDAKDWHIAFSINGQTAGNTLMLFGVDAEVDPTVRQYDLTAGRWLQGEEYEVVVTETYANDKTLSLGDDLVVLTPDGQERLEIVGLAQKSGAGLLNDGAVGFIPLSVLQDAFSRGADVDQIDLVAAPEVANSPDALEALKEGLAARLGDEYDVLYPASRGQLVTQMLSTYQSGLSFFSVVAIFVGAFLIYNAFSMTVLERTRELGLLRTLGMTRLQILGLVLAEALVLGLIGSVLGVGFGVVLARGLIWMLGAVVATSVSTLSIPLDGLIQSLAVGGMVTLGSALWPAIQAARISPLEALRVHSKSSAHIKHTLWAAGLALMFIAWASLYYVPWRPSVGFLIGQSSILLLLLGAAFVVPVIVVLSEPITRFISVTLFGNEGMLGAGNVQRSPGRTALTVASLIIGLSMVIANSSLAAAFIHDITAWVETALGGDLYVRAPLPMREQFERQLAAIPGVGGVTKVRYFNVKVAQSQLPPEATDMDTIFFAAIDPITYRGVGEMQFVAGQGDADALWRRLGEGDALFISTTVADRYNVTQGDRLRLITGRGEHDFYVAAVATDFTGQGNIVTGSWADMRRWFGKTGVDRFTLKLAPGYTTEQVRQAIEDRYKESRNISVETTQEFKKKILDLSEQSFRLFDVLGLIGIVVAALGVINTLMMNVIERQREIGGLRSLGLTRWQTTKMVLAEAATLGAIGGVFGLGFGYVLSQIFVLALNTLSGYDLQYIFALSTFITGAAIALVVSQLSALYPAWKAAGVNIVESIKHE